MDPDDVDLSPLVPLAELPPYWDDVPEEPMPAPRWSAPAPTVRAPAYGLVGMPAQTVTTRDVKTFAFGAAVGALVAGVLSWWKSHV